MRVVLISGSNVGTTTRTVINRLQQEFDEYDSTIDVHVIDLAEVEMVFADGRNYLEYTGDTGRIAREIMEADALIIGTPIFQASIPAALKNVFDVLPANAFRDKVVGMFATAGSAKHYLVLAQQLQPILTYMKAQLVQPYVFVESADVLRGEIVNHDVIQRLGRMVEDAVVLTQTYQRIREEKEASYGF
ncbi:NADPH-dependent FMN reductase [Corynebacterium sp. L4756]|uniref:NADPH-dependent FMN reductase n=1 Tax=unclassified Corynebacterium TaxID=2624378 RepID=UPI00374D96FD